MADDTSAQSARARKPLTQERLKELLRYDPETGIWTRLINGRGYRAGSTAGCVNKIIGYHVIAIDGAHYYAHRLVWLYVYGRLPDHQIDHLNGDRRDNRFLNLREATPHQNMGNMRRSSHNTSGFKGVSFNKFAKKFSASIHVNDTKIHIGYFKTANEAHDAYTEKALEVFGEFARPE